MKRMVKTMAVIGVMAAASPAAAATTVDINSTVNSPVTITLAAGDYAVSLVKGTYTAWAPATPAAGNWADYYQYTINGSTTFVNPLLGQRFATPDLAFAAYSAFGPSLFSLAAQTAVTFNVTEIPGMYGDNSGGVSLAVTAVPEPASWAMLILGFLGIGTALRRSRRAIGGAAATA